MNNRRLKKAIFRILHLPGKKNLLLYLLNKLKHYYLRLIRSTTVAYPSTVMIELTNHCNLRCTTCPREYDYGKAMDKGTMPAGDAKRVIDELWPYLDSIGLTGMGETFMYGDICEVVDYIRSKNRGIIISVSTNAMLPDFITKVSPLINKIDTIQISIDGLNQTYEAIRKNACFEKLDENLRELVKLCEGTRTTLMLNMVVTSENYHQMPELIEYSEKRGIKYMDFTLFNLASVTGIESSYYQFYSSDEFLKSVKKLNEKIKTYKNVTVTGRNFKTDNGFRKCPFPWTHFYICQDGYITPCCAKPFPKEMNFGNISDKKVIDILNCKDFKVWRKMWYRNITPEFCEKCHFIALQAIKQV